MKKIIFTAFLLISISSCFFWYEKNSNSIEKTPIWEISVDTLVWDDENLINVNDDENVNIDIDNDFDELNFIEETTNTWSDAWASLTSSQFINSSFQVKNIENLYSVWAFIPSSTDIISVKWKEYSKWIENWDELNEFAIWINNVIFDSISYKVNSLESINPSIWENGKMWIKFALFFDWDTSSVLSLKLTQIFQKLESFQLSYAYLLKKNWWPLLKASSSFVQQSNDENWYIFKWPCMPWDWTFDTSNFKNIEAFSENQYAITMTWYSLDENWNCASWEDNWFCSTWIFPINSSNTNYIQKWSLIWNNKYWTWSGNITWIAFSYSWALCSLQDDYSKQSTSAAQCWNQDKWKWTEDSRWRLVFRPRKDSICIPKDNLSEEKYYPNIACNLEREKTDLFSVFSDTWSQIQMSSNQICWSSDLDWWQDNLLSKWHPRNCLVQDFQCKWSATNCWSNWKCWHWCWDWNNEVLLREWADCYYAEWIWYDAMQEAKEFCTNDLNTSALDLTEIFSLNWAWKPVFDENNYYCKRPQTSSWIYVTCSNGESPTCWCSKNAWLNPSCTTQWWIKVEQCEVTWTYRVSPCMDWNINAWSMWQLQLCNNSLIWENMWTCAMICNAMQMGSNIISWVTTEEIFTEAWKNYLWKQVNQISECNNSTSKKQVACSSWSQVDWMTYSLWLNNWAWSSDFAYSKCEISNENILSSIDIKDDTWNTFANPTEIIWYSKKLIFKIKTLSNDNKTIAWNFRIKATESTACNSSLSKNFTTTDTNEWYEINTWYSTDIDQDSRDKTCSFVIEAEDANDPWSFTGSWVWNNTFSVKWVTDDCSYTDWDNIDRIVLNNSRQRFYNVKTWSCSSQINETLKCVDSKWKDESGQTDTTPESWKYLTCN